MAAYGVDDVDKVQLSQVTDQTGAPFLYWSHKEFIKASYLEFLAGLRKAIKTLNPAVKSMSLISPTWSAGRPWTASLAGVGSVADLVIVDHYGIQGTPEAPYWYELYASASAELWETIFLDNHESQHRLERAALLAAMHTDGVAWFEARGLYALYQQPWHVEDGLLPFRVAAITNANAIIEKMEGYLYQADTNPLIAIAVYETEAGNAAPMYKFLQKSHIPVACLYLDNITEATLAPHKVIIIPAGSHIEERHIQVLQEWVHQGGILIAAGNFSLRDAYQVPRAGFALAELFGAVKQGYDIVPTSGKVLVQDADDSAYVISHSYGQGKSVLFKDSVLNPLASEDKSAVFKKILDLSLQAVGESYPVLLENCPQDVSISLREQYGANSLNRVLHLLDYRDDVEVAGVKAQLHVPAGYRVTELVYAVSGESIPWSLAGDYITFTLPPFVMYTSVVARMAKM